MAHPETTPGPLANIEVDIKVSPDEAAALDKMIEVERVETLYSDIEEQLSLGIRAVFDRLREQYGDRVQIIYTVL